MIHDNDKDNEHKLERTIAPEQLHSEYDQDLNLRPHNLSVFIGQETLKESLIISLLAAKQRGEALDHCLFSGPPGLGKTTLSHIIAEEMGSRLHITSGPVLDKASDLAGILTSLQEGDVLFIDEIHRIPRVVEEYLYSAMEDFRLDIMLDTGPQARSVNLPLKPFTLVGATTRAGLLTAPLRDRFGLQYRLELYMPDEIAKILLRSAEILKLKMDEDALNALAGRCRGTPRIANRILRRCRDVAQVRGNGFLTADLAEKTLKMLGVDDLGLDEMDRKILFAIVNKFEGGPVGLSTLSAALGEEIDTLEEVYEPYLIQQGLMKRTPRGRVCTTKAWTHLGLTPPSSFGVQESFI